MDPNDKKRIQANLTALIEDIRVKDVMPYLLQEDVCTFHHYEEIETEKTSRDKVLKLLRILQTKGPTAYSALCEALKKSGSDHLVQRMNSLVISDNGNEKSNLQSDGFPSELIQIAEELKEFYCRQLRYLSPIPWSEVTQLSLQKVFTAMQLVHGVHRHKSLGTSLPAECSNPTIIGMGDIFSAVPNAAHVRKVLIEGEPGIGKTTMACKLAFDWAQGSSCSGVDKFQLIFLLKAKDLDESDTLEDLLRKHLLPEDLPCETLMEDLKQHQQHLLFIIDGFDEVRTENRDILKLIQGKILSKSHVLVTARPGFMTSHLKCFDSILLNIGYSAEQQIEFATKFIEDIVGEEEVVSERYSGFIQKLDNDELMKDLCRNPLHLSILCMLQVEYGHDLPMSRTELFKQMHAFIMKRASTKLKVPLEDFIKKCEPLHSIAYIGLLEGRHQVTQEEVLEYIDVETVEHACFISKEIHISRFMPKVSFSFIHKSFQEYFAAVYIAAKGKKERIELLQQIKLKSPYYMVTSFLCGLLVDDDTDALKDILQVVNENIHLPKKPEVAMGIQFILENHNSHLILQCFSEMAQKKNLHRVLFDDDGDLLDIGHVCFSLLWCSESCVDGMTAYLQALDSACDCTDGSKCPRQVKVTIQMLCLEQRTGLYQKLLQAVSTSRHASFLHVHFFTSATQLTLLFSKIKEIHSCNLQTLELHSLNIPDVSLTPEQMKPVAHVLFNLKKLILHECSSTGLLTQLLSLVQPCNQLESLEISSCAFDEPTCSELCTTLEKMLKLIAFRFRDNSIPNQEFYIAMLDIICMRSDLRELSLSHLPSIRMVERRMSIAPITQSSSVHVFPSLSTSLQSSNLTTLSICNTFLGVEILENLHQAVQANRNLTHFELRENHIIEFRALDKVLSALVSLPNFESLSLRRTELDVMNYQVVKELISESTSLKSLIISAWMGSLDHLATGLANNESLEILELRNLQFHDVKVKKFAEAVGKHTQLRQLHIGCNRAAPVDMPELIQACAANQNLRKIMFVNFGLDSEHVHCVGGLLEQNHNISSLDLTGNDFTLEDLGVLSGYLGKRPKLKFLNICQSAVQNWHPIVDELRENVVMLKAEWF